MQEIWIGPYTLYWPQVLVTKYNVEHFGNGVPYSTEKQWKVHEGITVITLSIWKVDLSKQCRSRSEAAECDIWWGSTLFATHPVTFKTHQ